MKKTVEELLQCPYWIIDILPLQVPEDSPGQYFAVEKYFLQANCYRRGPLCLEAQLVPAFNP